MKPAVFKLLSLSLITLACAANQSVRAEQDVVATVNGQVITQMDYDLYLKQRGNEEASGFLPPEMIVEELINRELITQNAKAKGLDKHADYQQLVKGLQLNLLAGYAIQNQLATYGKPGDDELRKEYQQLIGDKPMMEYKARHILLETEQAAIDAIKALEGGADFAELAKEKSAGPSGPHGGDLGWFNGTDMIPSFTAAVAGMEKGSYSKAPVNTEYGWHVILLEDSREVPPPSFESVREQLATGYTNRRIQEYIKALRSNAKIEHNRH